MKLVTGRGHSAPAGNSRLQKLLGHASLAITIRPRYAHLAPARLRGRRPPARKRHNQSPPVPHPPKFRRKRCPQFAATQHDGRTEAERASKIGSLFTTSNRPDEIRTFEHSGIMSIARDRKRCVTATDTCVLGPNVNDNID